MTPSPPNVLILQSDQHSHRFRGRLDSDRRGEPVRTPALDDLATPATVFEEAYCQMPVCTPSRLCTLTGREVQRCGAWTNGSVLFPEYPTLPGVFSEAGYETCHVGKLHVGGNRQFCGFDRRPYGDLTGRAGHQNDPPVPTRRGVSGRSAYRHGLRDAGVTEIPESLLQETNVTRETLSFLREHRHENPEEPWLVWASFSRPHTPFTAPRRYIERYWDFEADAPTDGLTEPKVGREGDTAHHPFTADNIESIYESIAVEVDETERAFGRAGYFACVEYLDEVIGELLALLDREGFLEDTIVVYLSDHGEMAGEHGLWFKGTWHEGATHVPLIVQLPDHRRDALAANHVSTPVGLIDLFPTLAGITGIDPPDGLDGVDLSDAIRTRSEPDRRPVVCDHLTADERSQFRMVRDGRYKYVHFREHADLMFDLEADPFERTNLVPNATGEDADKLADFRTFVDETLDFAAADERRQRDDERAKDHALGIPTGSGLDERPNAYLMPDGRLVGADTPLYKPDVFAEEPAEVFPDWPDNEPE